MLFRSAPTTTEARLAALQRHAQGYLYYVSFAGVTGAAKLDTGDVAARAAVVRRMSPVPVLIGFGIRDAESAKALAAYGAALATLKEWTASVDWEDDKAVLEWFESAKAKIDAEVDAYKATAAGKTVSGLLAGLSAEAKEKLLSSL